MKRLINKSVLQKYGQFTNKRNDDIIEPFIDDAQFIDLQQYLCEAYFFDLINNPDNYPELINGSTYEYDGITYTNVGLELVLTKFVEARYKKDGNKIDTPYGLVNKDNPNSHEISEKAKLSLYTYNRQKAVTYFDNVLKFLTRTNYKGYNDTCPSDCTTKSGFSGFKTFTVKAK